jgi:predicted Rossmann-fold nucleotide-binding protein
MEEFFPLLPFRTGLYRPEELFAGFSRTDPTSYATTPDFRAYRSTRLAPSREVGMLRALHDQSITEARDQLLVGHRVVAVMGGHGMPRNADAYREVAHLAAELTRRGFLVCSGGGPGAMEATHLGAVLAREPEGAVDRAVDRLAARPHFPEEMDTVVARGGTVSESLLARLHHWQVPAFEVLDDLPPARRSASLAVPTWFYGHEPPTPLATHLAKYFSNPLREDGLLAIAHHGVVYAPGRAGTLQEVFQDAAQNYYLTVNATFSPMVFLDTHGHWTERYPVLPVLRALFGDEQFDQHVHVTPTAAGALDAIDP